MADGLTFYNALTAFSPVYRLTVLWDGERHPANPPPNWRDCRWDATVKALEALDVDHAEGKDSDPVEREGLALLWPLLGARIDHDVEAWPWIPSGYLSTPLDDHLVGMFAFEIKQGDHGSWSIELHMGNQFAPASPFADMSARARELSGVLDRALDEEPRVRTIRCNSWMNSFGPFLALVPVGWSTPAARTLPDGYGYNWWGQLVSRTGGFHTGNGEYVRAHGVFPYPAVDGSCSIPALRDHLRSAFGVDPGVRGVGA